MSTRRAWLTYTLGRVGLFVLSVVLLWGASGLLGHPLDGLPLLLAALLLSSVLAFALLKAQREAFAASLHAGREARAATAAARRARLDDAPPS